MATAALAGDRGHAARAPRTRGPRFVWLATALSLAAFIGSAIAAHLITLLTATGLSARDAVLVGSLIGPMQVAGRIMEFAFNRRVRALAVGALRIRADGGRARRASRRCTASGSSRWRSRSRTAGANGIMTIVRGTVPAELFGHRDYGALLGRLAQPQFVMRAVAPFALTLLFLVDPPRVLSPYALLVLWACAAVAAYRARYARRAEATPSACAARGARRWPSACALRASTSISCIAAVAVAQDERQRHALAEFERACKRRSTNRVPPGASVNGRARRQASANGGAAASAP